MFRHTGIVRRVDDVGRIVIPKEVRRRFRINEGEPIEIGEDGDFIALRKYSVIELGGETIQKILQSYVKITSKPVILCSTTHVLNSFGISIKVPEFLESELYDALQLTDKKYSGYEITADSKLYVAALEKICVGENFEGVLIIPETSATGTITETDKSCLKLCSEAIAEILY